MKSYPMELSLKKHFIENVVTVYKCLKDIFKPDTLCHFSKCGKEKIGKEEGKCINKWYTYMIPYMAQQYLLYIIKFLGIFHVVKEC